MALVLTADAVKTTADRYRRETELTVTATGDGSAVTWTSPLVSSGTSDSASHVWKTPGTYDVKVKARDEHGAGSDFCSPRSVAVVSHAPNKPSTPTYTEQQVAVSKPSKSLLLMMKLVSI